MTIPAKRCSQNDKCLHPSGPELPSTLDYFYKSRNGLHGKCKFCHKATSRKWAINNPERSREYERKYRAQNPEKIKAAKIKYRSKPSTKQKEEEYRRNYLKTRGHIQREAGRRWTERNREYRRRASATRRARKRKLSATFSKQDWIDCLEYWEGRCAYCGRPVGLWHTLSQDHFIAEIKGGSYTPDNILPACHGINGCNNKKHARDPKEWLISEFGKYKASEILNRIEDYFEWVKHE